MKKAFEITLQPYFPLLRKYGIPCREQGSYLIHKECPEDDTNALFISLRTSETPAALGRVLPELHRQNIPFALIKDPLYQYKANAGAFGENHVGRNITIHPADYRQTEQIASYINRVTQKNRGPVVPGAFRLGPVLYSLQRPSFPVDKEYRRKKSRWRLLTSRYIPVEVLRSSPKGDIFKAINMRNMAFDWCLIKQGKPNALDDYFGRDMRDRMMWQKEVIEDLSGDVLTPRALDFFDKGDECYLITEYAEGKPLGAEVSGLLSGRTWKDLHTKDKSTLLNWLTGAIEITSQIHQKGYVHRDITDSNFILLDDGRLCVIDFELSYSYSRGLPDPPFVLGTHGYAAPEQLQYAVPDVKEDIYSLGALLCFMLSGVHPADFIERPAERTRSKLQTMTGEMFISRLAASCIDEKRNNRPDLQALKNKVLEYYNKLNQSD